MKMDEPMEDAERVVEDDLDNEQLVDYKDMVNDLGTFPVRVYEVHQVRLLKNDNIFIYF